ncbi:MAG: hypothetical protein WCZ89_00625 [Phycisphaerae bacterium]
MKIQCPKCRQAVPAEQVNMGNDLAFCPRCNAGFKISQSFDLDSFNEDVLHNPPNGAWFREEIGQIVVGASTRSAIAFFLVPFMCVWSGGALGGIYGSQIISGKFNLGMSLFGIPFVIGSIIFWALALMAVCGKIEVRIGSIESTVFTGVGSLGWTKRFDWHSVQSIKEELFHVQNSNNNGAAIILEGQERIRFGSGLNEQRRYFVLNALKYLKSQE